METKGSFFKDLSRLEKILLVILGVLIICLFCFVSIRVMSNYLLDAGESSQSNNSLPTQEARPNYRQMLEANGFVYSMNDGDGDPIYVSPCGLVTTVKPDYVGFATYVREDNCPVEDLGAIVSVMYPSDVFDFILSNTNAVIVQDRLVQGKAAGYEISMDFDPADYKLVIVIHDPR